MDKDPPGPGKIFHLNKTVRRPDEVLELQRKELDEFAERLVAAGADEVYKNQRVQRTVLAMQLRQTGNFEAIETHLINLREKILQYEQVKRRVTPMQTAPTITIQDISYADVYLERRKAMKATQN